MPKVLYVWKGKYPWDIRAEKICKAFSANGWDVYILARWNVGESEAQEYKGVNIIRAGYKRNYKLTQPLSFNPIWTTAIKKVVTEIEPDLIIPRDIMLAGLCGKIGKKSNIPVIMDMAENYPAAMKGWKKYRRNFLSRIVVHYLNLPKLVEKRAVKKMDAILTVCDEQNIRLNEEYGFSLDKICVVHNTPEREFFDDGVKEKREGRREKVIFGHHGFTSDEKSLVKFLFGFEQAAIENEFIELHIAGTGESIEDLKRISKNFYSKDRIIFYGEYKYEDLPGIISKWDIGVVPYQLNDFNNYTIHNKVFDFFAMGKPVFCSMTKPFIRLISETEAGIVANCEKEFEIRDSILKMLKMDLNDMGNKGRNAYESKYNWVIDSSKMFKFVGRFVR